MNKTARWISKQGYDDQCQLGFCGSRQEPIGHVAIETGGLRRGEWFWAMSQDGPHIDMRWERNGYEATEAEAGPAWSRRTKRHAAAAALDRQHGRIGVRDASVRKPGS